MNNKGLNVARKVKNDEFYTQYSTIENEVKHYKDQLKGKVVYCNCDDYRLSNFVKYFKDNFEELGIKKLYATHYINQSRNLFNLTQHIEKPKFYQYDGKTEKISELRGDGDFRSEECLEILKKSDIVITNPPFSLVRKLIPLILENNKDMLILATTAIIGYKDTFYLIKDKKIRQGYLFNKCLEFEVPKSASEIKDSKVKKKGDKYYLGVQSITWWTSLRVNYEIEDFNFTERYSPDKYPKYDNYDAINIDKTEDIPGDFFGTMGVPISALGKLNDRQFEILGVTKSWDRNLFFIEGQKVRRGVLTINGRKLYVRLLIRHKQSPTSDIKQKTE